MQLKGECFRTQANRCTQRVLLNQQYYFIKQYKGVGYKEIIKNILQLKCPILSAHTEWKAIQHLQKLSIPVPTLTAFGYRGKNPAKLHSFLCMEEITPIVSLEDLCATWPNQPPSFSFKLNLIQQVAHIAKTIHESGMNHRDFYICHFLLHKDTQKIYLIDLHRAGIHTLLKSRWIIKDIAGLYFSSKDIGLTRRDYWRFMKNYRQSSLRDIIRNESDFWQKIIVRGDKLYDAHARNQPTATA